MFELVIDERKDGSAALALTTPAASNPRSGRSGAGSGIGYVRARLTASFGPDAHLEGGLLPDGRWRTEMTMGARRCAC